MDKKLLGDAVKKFIAGVIGIGLMLFLPAGTLRYLQGWLFCGVLFIPVIIMGVVLFVKAPELLRKRLQEKEEQTEQKSVVALSGLMFLIGFVLAGLDYRFGWAQVPIQLVYVAAAAFVLIVDPLQFKSYRKRG